MNTLFEVLENNIILASDEELGLIVAGNGSYLNLYSVTDKGYEAIDCKTFDYKESLFYDYTTAQLYDKANDWLNEIRNEDKLNDSICTGCGNLETECKCEIREENDDDCCALCGVSTDTTCDCYTEEEDDIIEEEETDSNDDCTCSGTGTCECTGNICQSVCEVEKKWNLNSILNCIHIIL